MRIEWDKEQPEQEAGWTVRSAYERSVLSRAGVYGQKDDKPNLELRNPQPMPARAPKAESALAVADIEKERDFSSEAGFIIRELKYGPIFITASQTQVIEDGLWAIAEKESVFRGIHPAEAAIFLTVLKEQREERGQQLASLAMAATTSLELVPEESEIQVFDQREAPEAKLALALDEC